MTTAADFERELAEFATAERKAAKTWFFKTGPGEYGEGDVFLGVTVPDTRALVRRHRGMDAGEVRKLLRSPVHELRLAGLLFLCDQSKAGPHEAHRQFLDALDAGHVNNWDLVDTAAPLLVGEYLERNRPVEEAMAFLADLSRQPGLWHRRTAMVATFGNLKHRNPRPTLAMAELLVNEPEDLMHKAVGWMLREMGKRVDMELLRGFLARHAATMPRTALRYAIEKMDADERKRWLGLRAR